MSHTIPERRDQRGWRAGCPEDRRSSPSRLPEAQRGGTVRENRLKQWRRIAMHYEKRASTYRVIVVMAALMIWLTS
jgi:hypothetical protein